MARQQSPAFGCAGINHVEEKQNIDLIQCADDGWRPWSIVCVHLINGTSREWLGHPSSNPEVEFDWLCPKCSELFDKGDYPALEFMRPICIICVDEIRRKFDPNFVEVDLGDLTERN